MKRALFTTKFLSRKKATQHYMEKVWNRKFTAHFDVADLRNIYKWKIKSIPCTKLGEFNYKLIHNLIYPGYILTISLKSLLILQ